MLRVKPFEMPQPAALPPPCAFMVDPFSVADADWSVRTTEEQPVNGAAGHGKLPDQEAELPLPCALTEPDPSRQMPENVAVSPDTATLQPKMSGPVLEAFKYACWLQTLPLRVNT